MEGTRNYRKTVTECIRSEWITDALLNEFNIFADIPILRREALVCRTTSILYQGQVTNPSDVIQKIQIRIHLLYRRAIRIINRAWMQYWHLRRIYYYVLTELIEAHERSFKYLTTLIELFIDHLESSESINDLQYKCMTHISALQMLRQKLSDYVYINS